MEIRYEFSQQDNRTSWPQGSRSQQSRSGSLIVDVQQSRSGSPIVDWLLTTVQSQKGLQTQILKRKTQRVLILFWKVPELFLHSPCDFFLKSRFPLKISLKFLIFTWDLHLLYKNPSDFLFKKTLGYCDDFALREILHFCHNLCF